MNFRKITLCFLFYCIWINVTAQTSRIDSLEHALAGYNDENEAKTDLLRDISFEYRDLDPQKCREYAEQALVLARKIGSKLKEASAHNALGVHYYYVDIPYQAYVNYKKAENLFLEHGERTDLKSIYFNLLHLFISIQDGDNATHYANKLLDIAIEEGDLSNEIIARRALGSLRFKNCHGPEELDYYRNLYQKALPLNNTITYVISLYCGERLIQAKRYDEGLPYLYRALKYFETQEEPGFVMESQIMLADAYTSMHLVDSAELYLRKVSTSATLYEDTKMRLVYNQSVLDSIKGNYRSALANFKKYHHLSDSLDKDRSTNEVGRMKNWFEIEQKDKENQMLQQEQQKQNRLIFTLVVALIVILVLIILLAYFYWQSTKRNIQLKELHSVKDKLFSVVAHDLRSPIGSLMSILQLINDEQIDPDTQTELLKGISNRVNDTYGLLDNLLWWSRSQMQRVSAAPEYFDIRDVSDTVVRSLHGLAMEKQISLSNHIENQQVYADKIMFTIIIRNLLTNAIKFTFSKGSIVLGSKLSGEMLFVSVKDNGMGITPEVQKQLFSFSETRSKRGTNNESGTGLGLLLCAEFIKTNGGSIRFETQQGKGTTFFFSIPTKK